MSVANLNALLRTADTARAARSAGDPMSPANNGSTLVTHEDFTTIRYFLLCPLTGCRQHSWKSIARPWWPTLIMTQVLTKHLAHHCQIGRSCGCRLKAQQAVSVPDEVLGLLADLRELLQNKMEPPVYVSDRRLVKAIALLKVRGKPTPSTASFSTASPTASHLRANWARSMAYMSICSSMVCGTHL